MKNITWIMLILFISLLSGCHPNPPSKTLTENPSISENTEASIEQTLTNTQVPSLLPNYGQSPPEYEIVSPDFYYQFNKIPSSHAEQKLLAYWKEYPDSGRYGGYLEYLTLNGERGRLMEITFSSSTGDRITYPDLDDGQDQFWIDPQIEDRHSLVVHQLDKDGKRSIFVFDLMAKNVLGISFKWVRDENDYSNWAQDCIRWSIGEYYLGGKCANQNSRYLQEYYGGNYNVYYFFISRDNPQSVIFFGDYEGTYPPSEFYWRYSKGIFGWQDRTGISIIDVGRGQNKYGQIDSSDQVISTYSPSPDGKWLEIRDQDYLRPHEINLLPMLCLDDPAVPCEAAVSIPVWDFMQDWRKDCRAIDFGIWSPTSQKLLWITQEYSGGAGGVDQCSSQMETHELWGYDLAKDTLELIGKIPTTRIEGDTSNLLFTHHPTVWSDDSQQVVMFIRVSFGVDQFYSVSISDGTAIEIGMIEGTYLGPVHLDYKPRIIATEGKDQITLPTDYCQQGFTSHLRLYTLAIINPEIPTANLVREDAGRNNPILGEIQPGEAVKVLKGPKCVEGFTWWYVESRESNLIGWTAEGEGEERWLIPAYE